MTGPRLDSFQKALQRFKKALPPNLVDTFSVCSLDDVRDICRDIQDAHGRKGTLRYMRRLEPFIEAMEQFGRVIEMFANVNEIVCFIWGPIKFLLGITRTHMNSFDKLLDVYDKIGNAIPGLLQYQAAFEKHPPLATVLEDYYTDILVFHQAALSVFRRPRWKELFHSTWKTFDSKFGPILQSMKNRHELLESQKGSATLYEIQELRQDISKIYAEHRNQTVQEDAEKHRREVCYVREKLEAPNYGIDQEMSTEDRHGHSSGMWIFKDPSFCSWSNNDTSRHGVLYVNGIPGAGKTTLVSVIIEELLDSKCSNEKRHCVAYFYFKQKQPNKMSHNSSLRALLLQLVELDSTISDHLFEKMSSIEGVNLRSTKVLESLVKTVLESSRISYIVLDGLDECAPNEAAKCVEWFLSLVNGGLAETNAALRVLFCGQRDGTLDKLLSNQPSISLEASGHVEHIRQYCRGFAEKIREKFKIPLEMEEEIIIKVSNEAEGMFLYARVVLENLWNQTRRSRLKEEIKPGTFPQGIEEAYERVAVRIFEMSSMAEREDAKKILGWIICASRLLRWREIQSLFCIDPVKGDVDYEERRLRVTCKELCGSLIDVHYATDTKTGPEDVIKIVHETAREYLVRRKWLDASFEHARLAIFCSRYLTSEPFARVINEEDIVAHAVKGYYALQDYAVQYWFGHFRECTGATVTLEPDQLLEVTTGARVFLESYGLLSKVENRHLTEFPGDSYERNKCLNIEHRTILIRKTIEALDRPALDSTTQEILNNLHGNATLYKCTKPWCESFTVGFENTEDRRRHTDRHDLPFHCPFGSCFAFQLGYDTRAKLDQHRKSHHPEPENEGARFPKVNKKRASIWAAAEQGDLATVSALLDSGVNVNQRKINGGQTLLYWAAESDHFELCKILLKRGADINFAKRQGGRTALHAAVVAGNPDIVHLLVNHKECRPDQTDKFGRSPFCEACALGHLDVVKLLLETENIKTDVEPQRHPECCNDEIYSSTLPPFGYACGEGHFAVVQYLLQQGQSNFVSADILIRATRQGHEDIVDLLRPIMAKLGNRLSQSNSPSNFKFGSETKPFRVERDDWIVAFNPAIPLALDIELSCTLQFGRDELTCIQFSPDGKYLAIGQPPMIYICLLPKGGLFHTFDTTTVTQSYVNVVCFSPDGKYLATKGNGFIGIWDLSTGIVRSRIWVGPGKVKSLGFAHDGRTIFSLGSHSTVQLWDIDTSTRLTTLTTNDAPKFAISRDMKLLAASSVDGSVWVWNIHTSQFVGSLESLEWRSEAKSWECGSGIAFSPNGRNLVSASYYGTTFKMWDLGVLEDIAKQEPGESSCIKIFEGHQLGFHSQPCVLSASYDHEVRFWDCHTGETQFIMRRPNFSIDCIATSPTGDYFAIGSSDERVRIWSYTRI
ncbi:WD40 repeat-like protein [Xylaria castorea]|nr:WD40 repeat-like protein [Xylaria castorea]